MTEETHHDETRSNRVQGLRIGVLLSANAVGKDVPTAKKEVPTVIGPLHPLFKKTKIARNDEREIKLGSAVNPVGRRGPKPSCPNPFSKPPLKEALMQKPRRRPGDYRRRCVFTRIHQRIISRRAAACEGAPWRPDTNDGSERRKGRIRVTNQPVETHERTPKKRKKKKPDNPSPVSAYPVNSSRIPIIIPKRLKPPDAIDDIA
ncbi:hypothetical protein BDK51DRAFT_29159 [Blyttiomyces helicus]|uniref:Uncharacterized protein n=1 Tax=Blyttiomyces helicus TaxID=388810 RepID=A0A4P9W7M4_9FUNG|nr:hypothetical protein BDK51DRAFT_29159 [Blyttiomyces helicus]|eukprot:RKO88479.1 hypothetical protein BDK51DRAFT_29159 [Blyttiomyces helicus]